MLMLKPRRIIVLLSILLCHSLASGQSMLMRSEIGITGGGMNYIGDLNDQSMLGKLNSAVGFNYRYAFDNRWSMSVNGAYGHVEGGNPDAIYRRNLSFRSHIYEASVRMEFTFVPFGLGMNQYRWTPYLFCGLGLFTFNPKAQYTDPTTGETAWYDLQPLGTEGQGTPEYSDRHPYALTNVMMPFGLGFRFKPNKLLSFSIEYGFRKTWTDYLDDCSLTYVGSELLDRYHADGISAALADRTGEVDPGYVNGVGIKRGDDSLDDWYAYINFTINFRLDQVFWWVGKKKCNN